MKRAILALIILCAIGCDEHSPTAPSPPGNVVRGTVRDYRTQEPVPNAVVVLGDETAGATARVTTDAAGAYSLSAPPATEQGAVRIAVNGVLAGFVRPGNLASDLFVNWGTCVARYGRLLDAQSGRPVAGATVMVGEGTATSTADGSYRIDLGCPENGLVGFNTTFIYVTHTGYAPFQQVAGRGVFAVQRNDLSLTRQ